MQSAYAKNPLSLPVLRSFIDADLPIELQFGRDLPQPYRSLLDHSHNMTPTLCAHFGAKCLDLQVLCCQVDANRSVLHRVVLLRHQDKPVELGAIEIHLDSVDLPVKEEIIKAEKPLGQILSEHQVDQKCHPQSFFSVIATNGKLKQCLKIEENTTPKLYGRMNLITTNNCKEEPIILAEVVEILPILK
jgi:chorismate-pyruvate lyase